MIKWNELEKMLCGLICRYSPHPLLPVTPSLSFLSPLLLFHSRLPVPTALRAFGARLEHPQMISPKDIGSRNFLLNRHSIHLIPSLLIVVITIIVSMRVQLGGDIVFGRFSLSLSLGSDERGVDHGFDSGFLVVSSALNVEGEVGLEVR
jgi:hypothetical protein